MVTFPANNLHSIPAVSKFSQSVNPYILIFQKMHGMEIKSLFLSIYFEIILGLTRLAKLVEFQPPYVNILYDKK